MSAPQVEVYVTKKQTLPAAFDHIGQVEASQTVDVRARVAGVILTQGFVEGTTVSEGAFLFRIDPRPFEADLAIAEAKLLQQQVTVQAEKRNLVRAQTLSKTNNISREDVEDAQSKYNTALAGMKLAEADRYKTQLELSYTTVTAPISGKIGRAEKRPGDLVDTTANSLLCTITKQNPAWIIFHVSERESLEYTRDIKSGKLVLPPDGKLSIGITLLDKSSYPYTGEINFFDVKIDPQTGQALVRADLPNPAGILVPGQFVTVHVRGVLRPDLVIVPQEAVMQGIQGAFVYVVDDHKTAEMRPVKTSSWEGSGWIIESGLGADEKVITGGLLKVRPGAEVDVTTVTRTIAAASMGMQMLPSTMKATKMSSGTREQDSVSTGEAAATTSTRHSASSEQKEQ
jgi:membrane fusion protein (multidrug efflux system)